MKLGMPTLIEFNSLKQNVEICNRLNLDFIELNMNLPICLPENLDCIEIVNYKKNFKIDFTLHLPEELDLTSFHPSIRNGHLLRCKESMEWASRAGINVLNMHFNNGIYFTLPEKRVWINEQYENEFLEILMESYSSLYEKANSLGIHLCIENTGNFHISFVARALEILKNKKGFSLTWDVGHDAKAGFVEEEYFMNSTEFIRHMHLHDFNGKSDHQPLYTGLVPIDERLDLAEEKQISVVIEVKTSHSLEDSIKEIRKHRLR